MCKRCESIMTIAKMYREIDSPGMIYLSYYEEDDKKIPAYHLGTGDPMYDQIIIYCPFCGRKLGDS